MEQLEIFDIPSPCIGVCTANSKGYCRGCLRSREERLQWGQMRNEERRRILRLCVVRKRKILEEIRAKPDAVPLLQDDLFDA